MLYFLISKICSNYKIELSLLTTFLLTTSPWHILFGRTNFEVNLALLLYLLAVYLFYLGLKKPGWLILSAVVFAISFPAYHSERIITPLTVAILAIRFRKILFQKEYLKYIFVSVVLGLLITLPTLQILTTPGFLARANKLSIFAATDANLWGYALDYHGGLSWVLNNKLFFARQRIFSSLFFLPFSKVYVPFGGFRA